MTTITDLYPTRGSAEVSTPRQDPVVWSQPGAAGPVRPGRPARLRARRVPHASTSSSPRTRSTRYRAELDRLIADPAIRADERSIIEPKTQDVRSIFEVHRISEVFARWCATRVSWTGPGRSWAPTSTSTRAGSTSSRASAPAGFYWHSDFETWHAEDGLPRMRTVSVSIALTENHDTNGGLMIMPGSHRTFVGCAGETPKDNYKQSLQMQDAGTPSHQALTELAGRHGIKLFTGPAGSATWFDCNCMHGSGDNITPYPRSNVFIVFNSMENQAVEPFAAPVPRPEFIGARGPFDALRPERRHRRARGRSPEPGVPGSPPRLDSRMTNEQQAGGRGRRGRSARAAAAYEEHRPDYPATAVRWALGRGRPDGRAAGAGSRAGTGKLTRGAGGAGRGRGGRRARPGDAGAAAAAACRTPSPRRDGRGDPAAGRLGGRGVRRAGAALVRQGARHAGDRPGAAARAGC